MARRAGCGRDRDRSPRVRLRFHSGARAGRGRHAQRDQRSHRARTRGAVVIMRLFVASGIFHPEPGGPATYLFRLLPELQARGHEVRLLTFGDAPVEGYPYPVRRIPRRFLPLRFADYARAARPLAQWSDLIFANSLGLPLVGLPPRPRVLKVVGDLAWERAVNRGWIPPTEDIDAFQTRRYAWQVMLLKRQRSREVRRADALIVPSEYLRWMVIGWGAPPERVTVIFNALAPDAAASTRSPDDARSELG